MLVHQHRLRAGGSGARSTTDDSAWNSHKEVRLIDSKAKAVCSGAWRTRVSSEMGASFRLAVPSDVFKLRTGVVPGWLDELCRKPCCSESCMDMGQ